MFDWYYGDPHFGHAAIIGMVNRPFDNAREMTRELVEKFNARVSPGDLVCWLGDAFFTSRLEARSILQSMNGRHFLVRGNHDGTGGAALTAGFEVAVDRAHVKIGGNKVMLCHYPPVSAKTRHDARYLDKRPALPRGEWLIHGHTHESSQAFGHCIHVGVDAWDYEPVSRAQIEELMA